MYRIILFTIGSVQEYISNSRKTSDLHNASNSLSTLIIKVIDKITKKFGGKIILPVLGGETGRQQNSAHCPNYFIASYENDYLVGAELKKMALEEFSKGFVSELKGMKIDEKLISQIQRQLDHALDIYWCDLSFDDQPAKIIPKLFSQLEALKNSKFFESTNEPEGEKCNLCGVNNAIFYRANENGSFPYKRQKYYTYKEDESISGTSIYDLKDRLDRKKLTYTEKDITSVDFFIDVDCVKVLKGKNYLKAGECLCGVCFKKRYIKNEDSRILSLSDYALFDWLHGIDPQSVILSDPVINHNSQAVYELWRDPLTREGLLSKLQLDEDDKKYLLPPTLYCLYRMDIDDLGKRMRKEDYPRELSEIINQFFASLKDKFTHDKTVKIVYAGGDDLLALMSVERSFEFASSLHQLFKDQIKDKNYSDLTYSQGLFFAHHKSPFSEVLRLSGDKLVELKNRYINDTLPKNGTVISILTEGYSDQSVFFKNSKTMNLLEFEELMDYFKNDSSYFHEVLGEEFINLDDFSKIDESSYRKMLFAEQKRLMKRSLRDSEEKTVRVDQIERILKHFMLQNMNKGIDLPNYFNLFALIKKLNSQKRGDR